MRNVPKILIIDDSSTSRFYMASALQKAGYQVLASGDGAEGFTLVLHEPPDCLIVDIVLPGMGGFEICRRLRSRAALRALPIIMVSTKNTPVDQAWGLRQGANRYLSKPFTEDMLLTTVSELLPSYKRPSPSAMPKPATGPRPAVSGSVQNPGTEPRLTASNMQNMGTGPRPAVSATQNVGTGPRPAVSTAQNVGTGPRPAASNAQNAAAGPRLSSLRPSWLKLIPHRREDDDVRWINTLHANGTLDAQTRYFYIAIDGHRSLEQLGVMMRMSADDILRTIRFLLAQRQIQLYEPGGRVVNDLSQFSAR
jgi:CheY-like chemotaxis protein